MTCVNRGGARGGDGLWEDGVGVADEVCNVAVSGKGSADRGSVW